MKYILEIIQIATCCAVFYLMVHDLMVLFSPYKSKKGHGKTSGVQPHKTYAIRPYKYKLHDTLYHIHGGIFGQVSSYMRLPVLGAFYTINTDSRPFNPPRKVQKQYAEGFLTKNPSQVIPKSPPRGSGCPRATSENQGPLYYNMPFLDMYMVSAYILDSDVIYLQLTSEPDGKGEFSETAIKIRDFISML